MPEHRLIVIGDGPERAQLESMATPNITFMGYQPDSVLVDHLQRARALVFAAEEDFGILPVEAQACGTPVIAYGKGGALETVRGLGDAVPTGVFFQRQDAAAVADAVRTFLNSESAFTPQSCRTNALSFSAERFREAFTRFVEANTVER
jgi:glycosyltransferase involved in cell wall biosynthesis